MGAVWGERGWRPRRVAFARLAAQMGLPLLSCVIGVVITMLPAAAIAQVAPASAPLTITRVDFGFGPVLAAERWQPVVVWIASDRLIDGVVSLEYQQDGSQSARVEAAFATTPGKTIPVELVIAPPQRLARMTLRVSGGPREIRRVYTQMPDENEFLMPPVQAEAIIIASIGETGSERSLATLSRVSPDQLMISDSTDSTSTPDLSAIAPVSPLPFIEAEEEDKNDRWRQAILAPVLDPAMVPIAWKAWDAAAAVVVRAPTLEAMDERRRAALMTWVEGGGRLIIVMDPTTAWTLGAAFPGDPLPVDAAPVERWNVTDRDAFAVSESERPSELRGRAMTLTLNGKREGWRLGWPVTRPAEPARGMLATGPVGMGIVTLLGVEPSSIPSRISAEAERSLWEQLLIGETIGLLPEHRKPDGAGDVSMGQWWYMGSGEDVPSAQSVVGALDLAASGLSVPQGVFVLVGLSMVVLAVLIGPLDFVVFRRRGLGGRTWLTALLWIGLATIGAYVLPGLTRSTQSTVRRVEVVDMLAARPLTGETGERVNAREYETAITGLFSVRPESWEELQDGSGRWWRGVSTTPLGYSGEASLGAFQPLRTRLAGSEGDVAMRCTAITSLSMPQWTFRGLMDSSPGRASDVRVRVTTQDERSVVRVEGLAPGASVVAASLLRPWELPALMLDDATLDGGTVELVFPASGRSGISIPGEAWSGWGQRVQVPQPPSETLWAGYNWSPEGLGALPGLRERNDAIVRRVHQFDANAAEDGSGYACLFLHLDETSEGDGVRAPLVTSGGVTLNRRTLLRVLIPWSRATP